MTWRKPSPSVFVPLEDMDTDPEISVGKVISGEGTLKIKRGLHLELEFGDFRPFP